MRSAAIGVTIDGRRVEVAAGTTVAAALLNAGIPARRSVSGEMRAPFCAMGICMECRATIDGVRHRLSCQTLCAEGMEIVTG